MTILHDQQGRGIPRPCWRLVRGERRGSGRREDPPLRAPTTGVQRRWRTASRPARGRAGASAFAGARIGSDRDAIPGASPTR